MLKSKQTNPAVAKPRAVTSRELLGAEGRLTILHEGSAYHLRITSNKRLILTK
ncbi:hemin uptake protein HemP [Magnetofaba australis]|uniref:hemin uptake protein HemP n=1 Tax=Magnetofaba australis TaxID=1472297 RepID=UPI000A19C4E5|nr:hemin uptake protein HemP [Magnetofaba australis]